MKLFNSMSRNMEELKPLVEHEISMYVCGPTVYNYAHVGNARPMIVFDTLRKTLTALGYKVKFVSNYTDVDDKIIKKAMETNTSEKEVSEKFIQAYQNVREKLHVEMPSACPKVTETMDEIIAFIQLLVDKGHAYVTDGDVYFRISSVQEYGKLSNQQIDDLMVGARIDESDKKENPLDFTLWKQTEEGIRWESPWSIGRPGWHTECVVMINKEFQKNIIDIHGGGMDLKFPHHENEIAQSRAAYHTAIANYWMHNGMVNIDGEKMSKSLGNVVWAKDMADAIGADVMRWMMLSVHYRAPLNISEESIETAKKEYQKVCNPLKNAMIKLARLQIESKETHQESLDKFMNCMQDDLNTPNAFAVIFETAKHLNTLLRSKECNIQELVAMKNALMKMLDILGIFYPQITLTNQDLLLFEQWEHAKQERNFEQADDYRKQLNDRGLL